MITLGIWDGHDSGAACFVDGRLAVCINEERLSRRKLEIAFGIFLLSVSLRFAVSLIP